MHRNGVALSPCSPCSPRPHLSSSRAASQLLDHRNPLHAVVIVHNPGGGGLDVRSHEGVEVEFGARIVESG